MTKNSIILLEKLPGGFITGLSPEILTVDLF